MLRRLIVLSGTLISLTTPGLPQEDIRNVSGLTPSPCGRRASICPPLPSAQWAMP
jgi:hypothetical protein